ncbi:YgaP-like transmembrane domain [Algibacter amylolyticus]|nr:YgaP-like transmembrane domain [Algibacter amylolyticus]
MSNFDRIVRFLVVLILLSVLYFTEIKGLLAIVIILICIPFLFASVTAHCPFYQSTNLSTYTHEDFENIDSFKDTEFKDKL